MKRILNRLYICLLSLRIHKSKIFLMNLSKYIFFVIIAVLISSCSTDVDLLGDLREIPVIHGIIEVTEPENFIRIERAVADREKGAFELAADPEEIYFGEEVQATITVLGKGDYILERVVGDDFGIPRAEGIFASFPNILYRIAPVDFTLEPLDVVEFKLKLSDSIIASSTIKLAAAVSISTPLAGFNLPLSYTSRTFFQYFSPVAPAFYQVSAIFNYRELVSGGEWEDKSLKYIIDKEANEIRVELEGRAFFEYLAANIDSDNSTIRFFESMGAEVIGAGPEFEELLDFVRANLGITGAQEVPVFSNIEGGVGVLTSKYTVRRGNIGLTPAALELLREGEITADLNFQ